MKKVELALMASKIFLIVTGVLVVIYMSLIMTGTVENQVSDEGIKTFTGSIVGYSSQLLAVTYVVLLIGVLMILGFSLGQLFSDTKRLVQALIKVVLPSVLIILLSYVIADDTPVQFANKSFSEIGETKWSGVGLIVFYIMFFATILAAFLLGPIIKLIKK